MIRTILVDDHKLFADGIERLLSESGHFQVVGKFNTGQSLLQQINSLNPDLVILDIEIRDLSGLDLLKAIRISKEDLKIVMLSMHEETVYIKEAKYLGANGYLVKSIEISVLLDSLWRICNDEDIFPESVTNQTISQDKQLISDREREILKLMIRGNTNNEISVYLNISPLTVKTHRRNMITKLSVKNSAELISKAIELGIMIG